MFRRTLLLVVGASLSVWFVTGCSKDYCKELSGVVCKKVPNTKACQKASSLTDQAACKGYLASVDKFIELTNLKVTTPPLKPPAQPVKKPQKTEKAKKAEAAPAKTTQKPQAGQKETEEQPKANAKQQDKPEAKAADTQKNPPKEQTNTDKQEKTAPKKQ